MSKNFTIELASSIAGEVKNTIGRDLTSMELDAVAQISRAVPPDPKLSRNLVARFYAKKIAEIVTEKKKPATIDQMREYNMNILATQGDEPLRQEIKADESRDLREVKIEEFLNFGQLTGYQLTKQINPLSRMRYNYALLDTEACYERTDYVFKWLLNDQIKVSQTGILCTQGKLRNIKMVRVGQAMFSNFIAVEGALIKSQKRIGFDFEEFRPQGALIGNRSVEFFMHFRDPVFYYDNNWLVSPFDHIRGWFRFDNPLRELSSLTLRLFDTVALTDIRVNSSDTVTYSGRQYIGITIAGGVSIGGIAQPPIPNPLYLETAGIPLISTSVGSGNLSRQVDMDTVTMSGFTTDDPIADAALIASYNAIHDLRYPFTENLSGRIFRGIASGQALNAPIDVSSMTYIDPGWFPVQATFNVLSKPRVTFTIEIISEDDSEDIDI